MKYHRSDSGTLQLKVRPVIMVYPQSGYAIDG